MAKRIISTVDGTPPPRLISNSGGRTSALMTFLEAKKGLRDTDYIVFANTGKEREKTLLFLHEQSQFWGIKIYWIEYCPFNKWKEVNYHTASRRGQPYEQLIIKRSFLPNPVSRFCTTELKIRPMAAFMRSMGHSRWDNWVGIRADEPARHFRANGDQKRRERWDTVHPLYHAGITEEDVNAFWANQPFKLKLKAHEGNCDLCFLKGTNKKVAIISQNPELAEFWETAEEYAKDTFRREYSYGWLRRKSRGMLFKPEEVYAADALSVSCFCGID